MELSVLKSNIVKLKTADLFVVLERWPYMKRKEIQDLKESLANKSKQSKRYVAIEIAEVCYAKSDLTMDKVGELELVCLQMYSTRRQWSAYHLSDKKGSSSITEMSKSPSRFKSRLKKQLRNFFHKDCSVSLMLHEGLLWGRLYLPLSHKNGYQPTRCLYFIHYPQSPVIIFCGMKAGFAEFVSQCLTVALGYKVLTELSLTGHHYPSLAELALNKFSEGGYAKYQKTHRLRGPLNEVTSRKRKASSMIDSENLADINREEKRQRLEVLDENFGENVQPTLERVEYKVELPYRNKEVEPDLKHDGNLMHSRVRFHGKSVLEGLRNLAAASYAALPLPNHLTCISNRARNNFLLAKPQKNVTATQHVNTPAQKK